VIILAASGANDRDGYFVGIPVMGQLAGALRTRLPDGPLRQRGYGQSGGRSGVGTLRTTPTTPAPCCDG
jgi:hypothetical protein